MKKILLTPREYIATKFTLVFMPDPLNADQSKLPSSLQPINKKSQKMT
jgi:hypothetical protein